jgi:hypothetical protein
MANGSVRPIKLYRIDLVKSTTIILLNVLTLCLNMNFARKKGGWSALLKMYSNQDHMTICLTFLIKTK